MAAGRVSDYIGGCSLVDDLPKAQWLLGNRGYGADWFRGGLQAKGIMACIPGRRSRNEGDRHDKPQYRAFSRNETMFASRTGVVLLPATIAGNGLSLGYGARFLAMTIGPGSRQILATFWY
jgi:hypothetical protein